MLFTFSGTKVSALGTLHVLPVGFALPESWSIAARSAEELVCEVMPGNYDLMPYARLSKGLQLRTFIGDQKYADLARLWAELEMDEEILPTLKPWAAALFLALNAQHRANGQIVSMESLIHPLRSAAQRLSALETEDAQWLMFDGNHVKEQIGRLLKMIDDSLLPLRRIQEVQDAWLTGNPAEMWDRMRNSDEMRENPDLLRRMFHDRHEAWRPRIVELLRSAPHSTLIMVGAGHLAGPNGILAIARQSGFEPVAANR